MYIYNSAMIRANPYYTTSLEYETEIESGGCA